jgi:hypothetical protein
MYHTDVRGESRSSRLCRWPVVWLLDLSREHSTVGVVGTVCHRYPTVHIRSYLASLASLATSGDSGSVWHDRWRARFAVFWVTSSVWPVCFFHLLVPFNGTVLTGVTLSRYCSLRTMRWNGRRPAIVPCCVIEIIIIVHCVLPIAAHTSKQVRAAQHFFSAISQDPHTVSSGPRSPTTASENRKRTEKRKLGVRK